MVRKIENPKEYIDQLLGDLSKHERKEGRIKAANFVDQIHEKINGLDLKKKRDQLEVVKELNNLSLDTEQGCKVCDQVTWAAFEMQHTFDLHDDFKKEEKTKINRPKNWEDEIKIKTNEKNYDKARMRKFGFI